LRPALVSADAGRGDWILSQTTRKAYADPRAVTLTDNDFRVGSLRATSYARPGKLFTANRELMVAEVGILTDDAFRRVLDAVLDLFSSHAP